MVRLETAMASDTAEVARLAPIVSWAFGGSEARTRAWLTGAGPAHVRLARAEGTLVGGLLEVPMGQFFGGKSVSTLGIAGVAIAPEARGRGAALELLRSALLDAKERGLALSTLYPSTYSLYRKAGYELAGSQCRFTLRLRALMRTRRRLAVESLGALGQQQAEASYRDIARFRSGYLDRGSYLWNRVRHPQQEAARGFGVVSDSGLEGYLYVQAAPPEREPLELRLSDFVCRSAIGFESLLAFLSDHRTTADRAIWHGAPADARLLGMPEIGLESALEHHWMLRLLDVRAALLGRGYPAVDADVVFELEDSFLPDNAGQWRLTLTGGVPELGAKGAGSTGAAPSVRLGVGALAALYTGFLSPWELKLAGRLDADEPALATLGLLFSGPAPGSADYF
jgi:predicted acetyltransferase